MLQPNGINHLAIASSDMKGTLQYFNDVLGLPLVALYWMHGAENTMHGFLALNESSLLAFVCSPLIPDEVEIGKSHAGNPGAPCSKGTMQHLAFNVDSLEDLLAVRDRIRSRGIHCFGPVEHGYLQSIYFAGPEGMTLECATLTGKDMKHWIDATTVKELGITEEELHRLRNPIPYEQPAEPVQNAPMESAHPLKMVFPPEAYEKMLSQSDEELREHTRDDVPPDEAPSGGRAFY
ncbi:MAG: VOC family protein [Candidatus Thiodiazotropha sp.]